MRIDVRAAVGRRFAPANILFAGIAVVVGGIAFRELAISATFADLLYLSDTLRSEDVHNKEMLARMIPLADRVVSDKVCRSDVVNAGLYFVLLNLEVQNSFYEYDNWEEAMSSAEAYIRHGLSCNPSDGYLWARLAMIRQAFGENSQEIASLMDQSVRFNPSEIDLIKARFFVWRRADSATLKLANDAVRSDVVNILNGAQVDIVKELLTGSVPALRPYILAQIVHLPASRVAEFRQSGMNLAGI